MTNGGVVADQVAWRIASTCATEAWAVGRALGVRVDIDDPVAHVRAFGERIPGARPSMFLDHLARCRSEIDVINGAVSAQAACAGLTAPCNEVVSALVRLCEREFPSWRRIRVAAGSATSPVKPPEREEAMSEQYPRDMIGFGPNPPHAKWPGSARIAVEFVINYEEGAENNILHGDPTSESLLTEFGFVRARQARRDLAIESMYEYGSRVGFWRLHRLFTQREIPVTIFGVAMALERNPDATAAMVEAGWDIASHGYRWVDHFGMPEEVEREHIRKAIEIHERVVGSRPLGHFLGRRSESTVRLVAEEGGFVYSQDSYADELPYWIVESGKPLLLIPYTADVNDHRFTTSPGFDWGGPFFEYARDAFDVLYAEGRETPKLMAIGLHSRLIGRPGRFRALERFVDHVMSHDDVWLCRGIDIAEHWRANFPAPE